MKKMRSFSIYLLKEGSKLEDALDKGKKDLPPAQEINEIVEGGKIYVFDNEPKEPWWKKYWGISQELFQEFKGALVLLPVNERIFVIAFGHVSHYLNDDILEYDFGIVTTLNALDPEKIKSTDILSPELARRGRLQSPKASNLGFFGFDENESIMKRITGLVKDEYKQLIKNITGSTNLRVSTDKSAKDLADFLRELLVIYGEKDYEINFPGINKIKSVKEPFLIKQLDEKLFQAYTAESDNLLLSIPDILNYDSPVQFRYIGGCTMDKVFDDVDIADYRAYQTKSRSEFSLDVLKKHRLSIVKDDGSSDSIKYSIYKCLLFDCELDSEAYHFCEGGWYRVQKDFIKKLKEDLDPFFCDLDDLKSCEFIREDEYNKYIELDKDNVICLDKENIAPKGHTQVEPCDLFMEFEEKATLVHIKISTMSATLSHLFNQGLNSVVLLIRNENARGKLIELVKKSFALKKVEIGNSESMINDKKFSVIYGIITPKIKNNKSENLPLFSRITLLRVVNNFKLMRVPVSVVFIKDEADRKSVKEGS